MNSVSFTLVSCALLHFDFVVCFIDVRLLRLCLLGALYPFGSFFCRAGWSLILHGHRSTLVSSPPVKARDSKYNSTRSRGLDRHVHQRFLRPDRGRSEPPWGLESSSSSIFFHLCFRLMFLRVEIAIVGVTALCLTTWSEGKQTIRRISSVSLVVLVKSSCTVCVVSKTRSSWLSPRVAENGFIVFSQNVFFWRPTSDELMADSSI